jgi:hypothetical protein
MEPPCTPVRVVPNKRKHNIIPPDTIKSLISFILTNSKNFDNKMVPAFRTLKRAADKYQVSPQSVSHIWKTAQNNQQDEAINAYRATPQQRGRKEGEGLKWNHKEVAEQIAGLRSHQRCTLRAIAANIGIPLSTLHGFYRHDKIIRHVTNSIKPTLTDDNKYLRILYAANKIDVENMDAGGGYKFKTGEDEVHVDEKWFF